MTKLLLVRHGETAWNTEGRYQGQNDVALNKAGLAQAASVASRLAHEPMNAAYTSDLQRARGTAEAIMNARAANGTPTALHSDSRLRELRFGSWEGLTRAEIAVRFPESLEAWQTDPLRARLPGGEGVRDAAERVEAFLQEVTVRHPDETVLVVTHGGVLQIMCCLFLGGNLSLRGRFRFSNASLSVVSFAADDAAIFLLNDTNHLPEGSLAFP